jgi:hypothetical protein
MAKVRHSEYPIGQLLISVWQETGLSFQEFFRTLGYKNTQKALKRFDCWVHNGTGCSLLIDCIRAWKPEISEELDRALKISDEMVCADIEKGREEQRELARAAFTPYIQAIPEESRPRSITCFAITGGNARQRISLPSNILDLPELERLGIVAEKIREHMVKSNGRTLYQGAIVCFQAFWRFEEPPTRFDLDGVLVGPDIDRRPGEATITLAGGRPFPAVFCDD